MMTTPCTVQNQALHLWVRACGVSSGKAKTYICGAEICTRNNVIIYTVNAWFPLCYFQYSQHTLLVPLVIQKITWQLQQTPSMNGTQFHWSIYFSKTKQAMFLWHSKRADMREFVSRDLSAFSAINLRHFVLRGSCFCNSTPVHSSAFMLLLGLMLQAVMWEMD